MSPSEIKKMTLRQLGKTFLAMLSPEWDDALEGRPKREVTRAAKTFLAVQRARLRLRNKQLSDIRDKLKKNEEPLVQGKQDLEQVLSNLRDVENVLNAASAFLGIVGRFVILAA